MENFSPVFYRQTFKEYSGIFREILGLSPALTDNQRQVPLKKYYGNIRVFRVAMVALY